MDFNSTWVLAVARGRPCNHVAEEKKARLPSLVLRAVLDPVSCCHREGEVPLPPRFPTARSQLPLSREDQCSSKPRVSHHPSRRALRGASCFRLESQKLRLTGKQRQAGKNDWFYYALVCMHTVLLLLRLKTSWVWDVLNKLISCHQSNKRNKTHTGQWRGTRRKGITKLL